MEVFDVICVKKGKPIKPGSVWLGMCSECVIWNRVHINDNEYYVTEKVCDDKDSDGCLQGHGGCIEGTMNLRLEFAEKEGEKVKKKKIEEITCPQRVACYCRYKPDSQFYEFLAKGGELPKLL